MSAPAKRAARGNLKKGHLRAALLFSAPAMIPMLVFWIYPIFRSLMISMTDWDYISPTWNFVWFENYASIFDSSGFYKAVTVTLLFALYTVIPSMVIGLGLAMVFQHNFRGRSVYRALLFSPWVTPTVAISIVWVWLFNVDSGLLNRMLTVLHLPTSKWISSKDTALASVSLVTVWKSLGYTMIFYASALEKVPLQLYEAASIDGANGWQKFKAITFPGISPTTFFLMVMMTINSVQAYDQISILTQGGPAGSTRTLLYLYYQYSFEKYKMGEATAIAAVLMFLTIGLSILQFLGSKKWVNYEQ